MRRRLGTITTVAITAILVLSIIGTAAAAPGPTPIVDEPSADSTEISESALSNHSAEMGDSSTTINADTSSLIIDSDELHSSLEDVVMTLLEGLIGDLDVVDDDDEDSPAGDETDESPEDDSDDQTDESPEDDSDDQTDESPEDDSDNDDPDQAEIEQHIHDAVNEERAAHGVEELSFDTELRDIARDHSEDMAEEDYLAHEDSDGNGFTDRYEEAGYECSVNGYAGGENVAQTWYDTPVNTDERGTVHYEDEEELGYGVVDQWMNSQGHQDNLLASHWENQGIGVSITEDNKVYVTQNFC